MLQTNRKTREYLVLAVAEGDHSSSNGEPGVDWCWAVSQGPREVLGLRKFTNMLALEIFHDLVRKARNNNGLQIN